MAKLTIVVAATGQGKTSFLKDVCKSGRLYVFDVQNEYKDLADDFKDAYRMRNCNLDMKAFIKRCNNIRGYNVICEEATGFFQGQIGKEATRTFLSKRHHGHNYFLVFHSINAIPKQILQFVDRVVLFKTNDERQHVEQKYPRLLSAFDRVREFPEIPKNKNAPTIQQHLILKML